MKSLKYLSVICALSFFGIIGITALVVKWGEEIKTEAKQVETVSSTHYLMPSIFPLVRR